MLSFYIWILFLNICTIRCDNSSDCQIVKELQAIIGNEIQGRLDISPTLSGVEIELLKQLVVRVDSMEERLNLSLNKLQSEKENRIELEALIESRMAIMQDKIKELSDKMNEFSSDSIPKTGDHELAQSQEELARHWNEQLQSLKANTENMIASNINQIKTDVDHLEQAMKQKEQQPKCFSGLARDYVGRRRSTTISGLTCQRWDSQMPHEHNYKESQFADCSFCEARNYCRDPGDDGYLWCYTTDPEVRWEGCGIPWCDEPMRNNGTHDCYVITEEDRYNSDSSSDDQTCENNKKRFVVTSDQQWPNCEDCCCQVKDCYTTNCTGCYSGTWHRTQVGHECQRWDSQRPHKHKMTENKLFQLDNTVTRAHNYCRDPSNSGFLWCYTMDPNERWGKCGIPEC